ncbi:cysteate synthase [Candidatus Latescibacterota bacterium]
MLGLGLLTELARNVATRGATPSGIGLNWGSTVVESVSHKYRLRCCGCGGEMEEDGYRLLCPACGPTALLETCYHAGVVPPSRDRHHFYSYQDILPIESQLEAPGPTIGCLQIAELSRSLGLENLWVLLSCYAPRHGASCLTCTFKEGEALGVFSRVMEQTSKALLVASAGNAARAYLEVGARGNLPGIVVIPARALDKMCVTQQAGDRAPLLIALEDAYYPDAIDFAGNLQRRFSGDLVREGGCQNVARRDAMGIPFHVAVHEIGRIPQHYVQAVGSGTGAIAAWEAAKRLASGEQFRGQRVKLQLVQNRPFTPIVEAWCAGESHIAPRRAEELEVELSQLHAPVLSNASPPYAVRGGVYDALRDTSGGAYGVTRQEAIEAGGRIARHVGIDPDPAASVAVAGLHQAVVAGRVQPDECVLLHITGGGNDQLARDRKLHWYPASLRIGPSQLNECSKVIESYLARVL